jgi:hypothetical protein
MIYIDLTSIDLLPQATSNERRATSQMSSNDSQVSDLKEAQEYSNPVGAPETRRRDDIIVLKVGDVEADGQSYLKLARDGHVTIVRGLCHENANALLDSADSPTIRRSKRSVELVTNEEKFDTWYRINCWFPC